MKLRFSISVSICLLAAVALAGACTRRPPAVANGVSDHFGQFVWQDLLTDDVDEANREQPDEPIAQWLTYVSVPDVDNAAGRVRGAGGRVLVEPINVGGSRAAIVLDPQDALLGLVELPDRTAPQVAGLESGTFLWHDYLAENVGDALGFYEEIAGFDSERVARDDGIEHYVLRRGQARAGMFAVGDGDINPNWLVYVRVEDPAALARRAESLGGSVILAPRADVRGGSLAIIADPAGAGLALQRWPLPTTEAP